MRPPKSDGSRRETSGPKRGRLEQRRRERETGQGEQLVDDGTCKNCFHIHRKKTDGEGAESGRSLECISCDCVDYKPWERSRNRKSLLKSIMKKLTRHAGAAIRDFGMIKDGDRILVGVSGGKDSLTLIHVLKALQRRAPIKFEIAACTVDPQTPEYDPSILKSYFKSLGIPYFYESQAILVSPSSSFSSLRSLDSSSGFFVSPCLVRRPSTTEGSHGMLSGREQCFHLRLLCEDEA